MSQRSSEQSATLRRAGKLLVIVASMVAAAVVESPWAASTAVAAGDWTGAQLGSPARVGGNSLSLPGANGQFILPSAPGRGAQSLQFGPPPGFVPPGPPPNMGRPGMPSNDVPPPPPRKKKPVRKLPPKAPAKKPSQPEQYPFCVVMKDDRRIYCKVEDDGDGYLLTKRAGNLRVLKSEVDHIEDTVTGATTRPTSRPASRPAAPKGKPTGAQARPAGSAAKAPAK